LEQLYNKIYPRPKIDIKMKNYKKKLLLDISPERFYKVFKKLLPLENTRS
jgi:hypothetical protein